MSLLKKRITGFSVFCHEQHEAKKAGFDMANWSADWKALTKQQKKIYHHAALLQQQLSLEEATSRIQLLLKYIEEMEIPGVTLALVGTMDEKLVVCGFGPAHQRFKRNSVKLALAADLLPNDEQENGEQENGEQENGEQENGEQENVPKSKGKSKIDVLRASAVQKMGNVAERDLKKKKFPYSKVVAGEFAVQGLPDDFRLRAPGHLGVEELEVLLASEVAITKSPAGRTVHPTDTTTSDTIGIDDIETADTVINTSTTTTTDTSFTATTDNIDTSTTTTTDTSITATSDIPTTTIAQMSDTETVTIPATVTGAGQLGTRFLIGDPAIGVQNGEEYQVYNVEVPGGEGAHVISLPDQASVAEDKTENDQPRKKLRWTVALKEAVEKELGAMSELKRVPHQGILDGVLQKQNAVLGNVRRADLYNYLYKQTKAKKSHQGHRKI